MNNNSIIFIGLNTYKTFTQLAVLKDERGAKPDSLGKINPTKQLLLNWQDRQYENLKSDDNNLY